MLPADPRRRPTATRSGTALADGTIDCVVSDHSPCTAGPQAPRHRRLRRGLGRRSPRCSSACRWCGPRRAARGITLADVVALDGDRRPADLVGLAAQGRDRAWARDADLVAFAPDASFVVDPARLHHRHPVTPYAGRRLHGVVRDVWLRGARVLEAGAITGEPTGRLLRREPG